MGLLKKINCPPGTDGCHLRFIFTSQVKDDGHSLGVLSLPLSQLLAAEELVLDRWFQLSNSGPASQILMRVKLGVSGCDGVREWPWEAGGRPTAMAMV